MKEEFYTLLTKIQEFKANKKDRLIKIKFDIDFSDGRDDFDSWWVELEGNNFKFRCFGTIGAVTKELDNYIKNLE